MKILKKISSVLNRLRYLLVTVLLCCTACASDPAKLETATKLEKARQAFLQQRYEDSAITLLPLVRKGNADAQYSLGYMYYYGLGVPHNAQYGRQLIQAAAAQNNARALQAIAAFAQQQATLGSTQPKPNLPNGRL